MTRRSENGCGMLLSIGAVVFVLSRCSAGPSPTPAPTQVASLDIDQAPAQVMRYATRNEPCRATARRRARVVGRLTRSDSVVVEGTDNDWSRVRTIQGQCWVRSASLSVVAPAPQMRAPPIPAPSRAISGDSGLREGASFQCGAKRVCRQMDSCAEANFYLNQCGLGRLDGDGDGIPCESIC